MATPAATPFEALVDALVGVGGPLASIVDHMQRAQAAGHSASDAPPVPEVLSNVLSDVLQPLRDEFSATEMDSGAQLLDRAVDLITGEILLVPPPPS